MTRSGLIWILALAALAMVSAAGVAYAKFQTRLLFADREALRVAQDEVSVQWRQLQVELATFAEQGRIESLAHDRLSMRVPSWAEIRIVEP